MNHCENNICMHKKFFPPTFEEYYSMVLILIVSTISNAAGSGGNIYKIYFKVEYYFKKDSNHQKFFLFINYRRRPFYANFDSIFKFQY